jgi:hypothetical protein
LVAGADLTDPAAFPFDLVLYNHTAPPRPTSYICNYTQLPSDAKYHITGWQALEVSPVIHHMILYTCGTKRPDMADVGEAVECPLMQPQCQQYYIGWGPGTDTLKYPAPVGLPIGKGFVEWVGLQVSRVLLRVTE